MTLSIRAEYRDGQIRLLEPFEFYEGQQFIIEIEAKSDDESVSALPAESSTNPRVPNLYPDISVSDDFDDPLNLSSDK